MPTRRQFLKTSTALSAWAALGATGFSEEMLTMRLNVGACDWSIGKRADIGAFDLAKQIGLGGIQVDLGTKDNNHDFRNASDAGNDIYKEVKLLGKRIYANCI